MKLNNPFKDLTMSDAGKIHALLAAFLIKLKRENEIYPAWDHDTLGTGSKWEWAGWEKFE